MSHRRFRFSLAFLVAGLTVAAIVCGLVQYRRQTILAEIRWFQDAGVRIETGGSDVWPQYANFAGMECTKLGADRFRLGADVFTLEELKQRWPELTSRLEAIGINRTAMAVHVPRGTFLVQSIEELERFSDDP